MPCAHSGKVSARRLYGDIQDAEAGKTDAYAYRFFLFIVHTTVSTINKRRLIVCACLLVRWSRVEEHFVIALLGLTGGTTGISSPCGRIALHAAPVLCALVSSCPSYL